MRLADAKEVDQIAVEVVENFNLRWWFMKEDLSTAGEGLDVGQVWRELGSEGVSNAVLATNIRERALHTVAR
jgi:hypothetical protein